MSNRNMSRRNGMKVEDPVSIMNDPASVSTAVAGASLPQPSDCNWWKIVYISENPSPKENALMRLPLFILVALLPVLVHAHCQVPCGVYTDEMRFGMIEEDLQTIEKAMTKISDASASAAPDHALITRWTITKEEHASKIQDIVSVYFMTQRIKPDAPQYQAKIATLHAMLISAMKCKQTLDASHVKESRRLAAAFHDLYFGKTDAEPMEQGAGHDAHDGHDHSGHKH